MINVTMPKDADTWIDVYYDDEDGYFTDTYMENGFGQFGFMPYDTGNHTLKLHYYGNEFYNEKYYNCPFEIKDYVISLVGDRIEYD